MKLRDSRAEHEIVGAGKNRLHEIGQSQRIVAQVGVNEHDDFNVRRQSLNASPARRAISPLRLINPSRRVPFYHRMGVIRGSIVAKQNLPK